MLGVIDGVIVAANGTGGKVTHAVSSSRKPYQIQPSYFTLLPSFAMLHNPIEQLAISLVCYMGSAQVQMIRYYIQWSDVCVAQRSSRISSRPSSGITYSGRTRPSKHT